MSGENLVALSNLAVQTNNCSEKKAYSRVGTASSIAFAIFIGTTVLQYPVGGEIAPGYNFTRPSYIQYINLDQEKGIEGLYTQIKQ